MLRESEMFRIIVIGLVITIVFFTGCTGTSPPPAETGTVRVSSSPPGAEVYLDLEYRGTTPVSLAAVPAGNHTLEVREPGYERWSTTIAVAKGSVADIPVRLTGIPTTIPVTFAPVNTGTTKNNLPQIHVDGYWTWPSPAVSGNPVPLLVHADSFNVGYADAREVTVSATLYYAGRQVCWNTIYLGTLKAGSHVTKDTMVYCTLPSGISSPDLTIQFDNVVVTP